MLFGAPVLQEREEEFERQKAEAAVRIQVG